MRRPVLAAAAALAIASGSMTIEASAADLEFFPPPAPVVPTWAGFYFGGHLGYGEARFSGRFHPGPVNVPGRAARYSDLDPSGMIGGVHAGYNWQHAAWVLGIEGDVSFADWSDRRTVARGGRIEADVGMLASVRGRFGLGLGNFHLYGTGGVAFSDARARATDLHTGTRGSVRLDDFGWVMGGGGEFKLTPRISLRGEGLYYIFDSSSRLRGIGNHPHQGPGGTDHARFRDAWVIRGGLSFHF